MEILISHCSSGETFQQKDLIVLQHNDSSGKERALSCQ